MLLAIPILVFLSVVLGTSAVAKLATRPNAGRLSRLEQYSDATSTYDRDLARPIWEKLLRPLLLKLGSLIGHWTPGNALADIEKRLRQADNPYGLTLNTFLLTKGALLLLLPVAYAASLLMASRSSINLIQIVAVAALTFVGYRVPEWWLDYKVSTRRRAINRSLPDALDLLVICSEAGLALEGAMARVVERLKGPLAIEMKRTLGEIALGKRRRDALHGLAERTEAEDLVAFVAAVVQADQTGISIGNVLHVQADDLRLRRRQRAEKEGRQAPLKMLFPNIFFIFPATLIVLIGPAALQIMDQLLNVQ
jgi:tight adherence protein C